MKKVMYRVRVGNNLPSRLPDPVVINVLKSLQITYDDSNCCCDYTLKFESVLYSSCKEPNHIDEVRMEDEGTN